MSVAVAVVGDGAAAALAAAVLARTGAVVTRVPTGDGGTGLGPFGPAVLAMPDWQDGSIAAALAPVGGVSFSLGIAFAGWGAAGDTWFLPFGDIGAPLDTLPFPQVLARLRAQGHPLRLADFALATQAAQAGRFAAPADDPRSPLSTLATGVHYPAEALAAALTRVVAVPVTAPLAAVTVDAGRIEALSLDDGSSLSADLYVDATGTAARLIGRLSPAWESWAAWLPCSRVEATSTNEPMAPPPFALHTATAAGWSATIPLDGVRVQTVYSVDGAGEAYANGRRVEPWRGNCVAVGAAAGVIEPVLGAPLMLALRQAERLADLLPHAADQLVEAAEYNRVTATELERARDAAVALWATNGRVGEALWDGARDRAPDVLSWTLDLYRSRGRVPLHDAELLTRSDWIALLDGQGLRPRRIDPLASAVSDAAVMAHAARLRDRLLATVRQMPLHADQLARYRSAA